MRQIDYIDPVKATKAILRDWNDQHWKVETGKDRLSQIDEDMVRLSGVFGSTPVQGGGNRSQEVLCAQLDKKTLAQYGYYKAMEFVSDITPCWERLSDEDRYMLTVRFIDRDERNGIKRIMERFQIEKSQAYEKSNAALYHLSELIFWKTGK